MYEQGMRKKSWCLHVEVRSGQGPGHELAHSFLPTSGSVVNFKMALDEIMDGIIACAGRKCSFDEHVCDAHKHKYMYK